MISKTDEPSREGSGKRIVVTGATGTIGRALSSVLVKQGFRLRVFSRRPDEARGLVAGAEEYVQWSPADTGGWEEHLEGVDGIVYLAGGSLYGRGRAVKPKEVTAETKTRIQGIRSVVEAIRRLDRKPEVFVSASSVGTYGYRPRSDDECAEDSPTGGDFWGKDSREWEEAAFEAGEVGLRVVVLRTGYVLDGAPESSLRRQLSQFQRGFGGPVLPGTQWVPWVHIDDVVSLILFALQNAPVEGPLNVVSPGIVQNRDFARALGRTVGKHAILPMPGFLIRSWMGTVADTITHGRKVVPRKALGLGFDFHYPSLDVALRDLARR